MREKKSAGYGLSKKMEHSGRYVSYFFSNDVVSLLHICIIGKGGGHTIDSGVKGRFSMGGSF